MAFTILRDHHDNFETEAMMPEGRPPSSIRPDDKSATNWRPVRETGQPTIT